MIIDITLPLIASSVGMTLGIASYIIARNKDTKEIEARITALETKIEPFWQFVNKELPGLIAQQTTPALDVLLEKSKSDNMSNGETDTLLLLLEREYDKAKADENTGRAFAIALYRETVKYKHNTRGEKK